MEKTLTVTVKYADEL